MIECECLAELPAWLHMPDGSEVLMHVEAEWGRTDPFAVELTFPLRGVDVVWLIGRDLLRAGLTGLAGEGDVCLWPAGDERIALALSSPSGRACIELDEPELREFLMAIYDAVPAGEEMRWIPLDRELTDLLNGSAL